MPARISSYQWQLQQEINQTPPEYLPNLLQIVRLFRESVALIAVFSRARPVHPKVGQVQNLSHQIKKSHATANRYKPAEESFRQGWAEAMKGETQPISKLWDGIDVQ